MQLFLMKCFLVLCTSCLLRASAQSWQMLMPANLLRTGQMETTTGGDQQPDNPAIIGGQEFPQNTFPTAFARIVRQSGIDCTGVLISRGYVLTSASCVSKIFIFKAIGKSVTVVLGDYSRSKNEGTEQTITGTGIPHPSYPSRGKKAKTEYDPADIGVVRLSTQAIVNANVQFLPSIALNTASSIPAANNEQVVITSWGATSANSYTSNSDSLLFGIGATVSTCTGLYDGSKQFCMDGTAASQQTGLPRAYPCNGDGGAPAFGSAGVIGVVSFPDSRTCRTDEKFVVLRTSAYASWISQYTA